MLTYEVHCGKKVYRQIRDVDHPEVETGFELYGCGTDSDIDTLIVAIHVFARIDHSEHNRPRRHSVRNLARAAKEKEGGDSTNPASRHTYTFSNKYEGLDHASSTYAAQR